MDASNPLSVVQPASPNLPTVLPSSGQAGVSTSTVIQAPDESALIPPAALQYQFNIQQSLLMQHYALAQQAAVKAATVKSAAEVAVARAAEISKQLEKKIQSSSTSKSTSRSPLRSKSKSRSKSRSLSPSRKRRARSNSRSPIRYRRDYHSSYRPRDHYGYRGYNYRSYYRGSYNDYSRYRYGRENYRRRSRSGGRRRSRTRSRSRSSRRERSGGRRRSQSLSPPAKNRSHTRSPRDLRKKSVSPHARRDGTKSRHNPVRSVSREAVRSPSVSSRSINASPPAKSRSRGSSQVKAYDEDRSPPTEPSPEVEEDRLAFVDRKPKKGSSVSSHERMQSSSSTTRSLSVSLNNESYRNASDKVAAKQRSPGERRETVKMSSSDDHEETSKRTSSDEHGSPSKRCGSKVDEPEGWNKHPGGGRRIRKPTRSPNAIFHDESESSDEILDDWRDDLKQVVKGKGGSTYKDGEIDRLEGRGRIDEMDGSVKGSTSEIERKHESIVQGASPGHRDSAIAVGEQAVATYKGYGPVVVCGEEESLLGESRHVSVSENAKEVSHEGDQVEQVLDEDVIFEGPKLASPVCEQRMQRYEARGPDIDGHFIDEESPNANRSACEKKTTGNLRIAEDDNHGTKESYRRHSREKKVKDRSRSRDVKKYEHELTKHEKRRDRHKKHRKKHKSVDEESAESDGARRRHKRKHRREEEHRNKEKKKRKHKHRTRSSSVSVDDSSSDSAGEVRSSSRRRKRVSKKHKAAKRDVLESPPLSASLG